MRRALQALGGVALLGAVTWATGYLVWDRSTSGILNRIGEGAATPTEPLASGADALPHPVARYLARALPEDGRRIRIATLAQRGEFRLGDDSWRPFRAVETFRTYPPAFLWDATIGANPVAGVRVRDAYVDGVAAMVARVGGIVPVVAEEGAPELAEGALTRYLAEGPWFPTRLLPGRGLEWTAVDDSTALATLEDGGFTVTAEFRFDAEGDVAEVFVGDRMREVDGRWVATPWIGRFRDHQDVVGFRIPFHGEVAWILPEGEHAYWRGRVESVRYDFER